MLRKFLKTDIVLLLMFIVLIPFFFGKSYLFHTFNIIGIYAIAVISLNLVLGITGILSLGHGVFFGLGAYTSAYLSMHFSINPFLSILISCMMVALISFLLALPLLRLSGLFLALATLGFGTIVYTLINSGGAITGGSSGMSNIPHFSIGSFIFETNLQHFLLIWITLFVVYVLVRNLVLSKEGLALKAVHSDEEVAAAFGIGVYTYKLKSFVFGGGICALSGGYYAHYMSFISPGISGLNSSIELLIMNFLGGMGTIVGPILGTIIFKLLPEVTVYFKELELLLGGLILLLVILFFPGGIQAGVQKISKRIVFWFKNQHISNINKFNK